MKAARRNRRMNPLAAGEPARRADMPGELDAPEFKLLKEKAPEVYQALMVDWPSERRHQRRLDWADLVAQIIGHMFGLAALFILAAISWHAIDRGDPTQAASMICTGAVSIVAVFVTGRLASGRAHTRSHRGRGPG
jgi:hypothetical protein